jgi:hypothetical protein
MIRLIINTLLTAGLCFAGTSLGLIQLYLILVPPKPGEWGAESFLIFLSLVCGLMAGIVGGITSFVNGSQRGINRWDALGWLIGLILGLVLAALFSTSWLFFFRCMLAGLLSTLLMLVVPPILSLLVGSSGHLDVEFDQA